MSDPEDPQTTRELVARYAAGDEGAFEALYRRYEPLVRYIIRSRLNGAERRRLDETDLLQTCFFRVARGISNRQYQEEGQFRAWLARAVRNKVEDALRREHAIRRDVSRETALETGIQPTEGSGRISMSRLIEHAEEAEILQEAMGCLSEDHREIILLRDFEELTWPQVAERLDCAQSTARERYQRAYAALGDLLPPGG